MKSTIRKLITFSGVGLICTLISLLLIFLLNSYTNIGVIYAYILAYGTSIILSYALNAKVVFRSDYALYHLLFYMLIYLSSMSIGAGLIIILKNIAPWKNWFISYMTVPFTMTWNFFFSKKLFKN